MKVTFEYSEDIANRIKTFYFKPEKPVHYLAGQFTEIYLPHNNTDNRGDKRWFTLSSSPTDPLLSITTKFTDKPSSFKQTLLNLVPGTNLNLADPMGDFVLPIDQSIRLLFVAGGIGVTPFHSMIKYLHETAEKRDIALLYSVSSPEETAFQETFASYDMLVTYLTGAGPGSENTLTSERILAAATGKRRIYISGPEPMVESLIKELMQKGIPSDRLVGDYFPGYT